MSPNAYAMLDNPPIYIFDDPSPMKLKADSIFVPESDFYNLNRPRFLQWLFQNSNAIILDGTIINSITVEEDGVSVVVDGKYAETIKARYVIGADGVYSSVRKEYAPKVNTIHSVQFLIEPTKQTDCFEMMHNHISSYYTWIIPKGNNMLVGTSLDGEEKLIDFVSSNYGISAIIKKESYPIVKIKSKEEICLGEGRVLLVGDAAGLCMPETGEGIHLAMKSAGFAAKSINEGIEYKTFMNELGVIYG